MTADEVPPASPPSIPVSTPGSLLGEAITGMAKSLGMTPQQFLFGGIAEVLRPMEERIGDRICDMIEKKFGNTTEVSKGNDALQKEIWPDVDIGSIPLHF